MVRVMDRIRVGLCLPASCPSVVRLLSISQSVWGFLVLNMTLFIYNHRSANGPEI